MLGEVADATLNFPILVMDSNSAEGDGLTRFLDSLLEEVVRKPTIVCVISFDGDAM